MCALLQGCHVPGTPRANMPRVYHSMPLLRDHHEYPNEPAMVACKAAKHVARGDVPAAHN